MGAAIICYRRLQANRVSNARRRIFLFLLLALDCTTALPWITPRCYYRSTCGPGAWHKILERWGQGVRRFPKVSVSVCTTEEFVGDVHVSILPTQLY